MFVVFASHRPTLSFHNSHKLKAICLISDRHASISGHFKADAKSVDISARRSYSSHEKQREGQTQLETV
ncbi:uncharacterized protein PHALS_14723 [Plasmopara halstedii]|uniref:Uncharacterized protein n=1 Tax=Plasmopara halstedii TaxID=4781 RepID=A0A0P1A3S4_PLAHL|nr:uncharacterized protein PHALS_14723 [Plasmopara halstedii]CEG35110.1 hypothetical protein PHALS_14723 [Plasmopara halstedii]|eukprot:XP_024571479.1 hypothetical protein PHALS_14723 [Plasmopara halstedii]